MPPAPNDPKKPVSPSPAGGVPVKTPVPPVGQKPSVPGQPPKPPVPMIKPTVPGAPRPPVPAAQKPAPKPAPKTRPKHTHVDTSTRQLAQKLVDLGYVDDAQLDSIYEEMRTSELKLGEICVTRGLVNEDQLLQATAETHGMRVANLDEAKPTPESIKVVPQNMAELYKLVPLSFDADTLTVALSDPNNLQALDDIRNFLGIRQVNAVLAPASAVEALMKKAYGGPGAEESINTIIMQLEADKNLHNKSTKRETSIDLDDLN